MDLATLFALESHGPDTFVGVGFPYPWGGLFGGHIVAQTLRAASSTVDDELLPHSLRAYFIRRGDPAEPVRCEVDRIRNGRSFATRRVVARQAVGAILNLEASFQRQESSDVHDAIAMPSDVPPPEDLEQDSWTDLFSRCRIDEGKVGEGGTGRGFAGRSMLWMKGNHAFGPIDDPEAQLMHRCTLAYLSDDLPTEAVVKALPAVRSRAEGERHIFTASLDHTVWFHRPLVSDEWHLYDFACHAYGGARGLTIGYVFSRDGAHVATVAQEVLLRDELWSGSGAT